MSAEDGTDLTFAPVTPANRADFEALFNAPGGPKYCWCMAWRGDREEKRQTAGADKRRQMLSRIEAGVPVGLLAYIDRTPRAWVSIAPKHTHTNLGGPEPGPDENVWSLSCMYVERTLRGKGLGHRLIAAAIAHARDSGATAVEAYPVDPDSPSYRFMGFVPVFKKAGFAQGDMIGTRRHLMRLTL